MSKQYSGDITQFGRILHACCGEEVSSAYLNNRAEHHCSKLAYERGVADGRVAALAEVIKKINDEYDTWKEVDVSLSRLESVIKTLAKTPLVIASLSQIKEIMPESDKLANVTSAKED